MKTLEDQDRKASTRHSILCRVRQGLTYVNLSLESEETLKAEKCNKLISNWLVTLGKQARRVKQIHLENLSDKADAHKSENKRFSHSDHMKSSLYKAVEKAKKGERIPQGDLRQIIIWPAGSFLHCNAQRPGAITNATVDEYRAATVPEESVRSGGEVEEGERGGIVGLVMRTM